MAESFVNRTHRPGKIEEFSDRNTFGYRIHCECTWGQDNIDTWDNAVKLLHDHVVLENSLEFTEIVETLKDAAGRRGNGRYNWTALAQHVLEKGYKP